ncbi:tetratricopeptide repeat protein [Microbispora sp. ZYX-F-249]|uniref:Tetratricopeptide repeat protein n=1 Tax=Microbispora maris TaxID=3144104 RepID=A0ABV0B361_9ACTN
MSIVIRQYQDLAAAHPELFDAGVSRALDELCARLGDDLVAPEQMVIDEPLFVQAELPVRLAALADRLAAQGRVADELDVCRLVLDLRQRLGGEFGIAQATSRLASPLTVLEEFDEALALRRDALSRMRRLAAEQEDRWHAVVAEAEALTALLVRLGKVAEATVVAKRLVGDVARIRQEWAEPLHASALRLHARMLCAKGEHAEAVAAARQAAETFRALDDSYETACTYTVLSDIHHTAGDLLAARRASEEALLAAQQDPADRVTLSLAWGGLAVRHIDLEEWNSAHDALREALALSAPRSAVRARHLRQLCDVLVRLEDSEAALEAMSEAVGIYRELSLTDPGEYLPELAICLVNLGIRYAAAGRGAKAVYASQEAVKHYLHLAETDSAWSLDLAQAYGCLSERLAEIDRHDRAAEEARRCAELYRQAADPRLGEALRTLGTLLHSAGDYEASAAATAEAAALFRASRDLPELAHALYNAAITARVAGRPEDALRDALESAEVYQRLYDDDDPAWYRGLAGVLCFLGTLREESGRFEHAVTSLERAVSLLERAYRPGDVWQGHRLASALHDLSRCHEAEGRLDRSLSLMRRSLSLYGELAQQDPDGFRTRLASAWVSLGVYLWRTDQPDESRSALRMAVDLYREAGDHAGLAHALGLLADRTADTGDLDAALRMAREAVEILEELALDRPEPFLRKLAVALDRLAALLCPPTGDLAALPYVERAADIWARLGETEHLVGSLEQKLFLLTCLGHDTDDVVGHLSEVQQDLARTVRTLNDVAQDLLRGGLLDHARRHLDRASALWEIHLLQEPDADPIPYVHVLDSMATLLDRQGRPDEAATAQTEVVKIFEERASAAPETFLAPLPVVLGRLAGYLRDADRPLDALPYQRRCVEVLERLAADDPGHRPALVTGLGDLGDLLRSLGHEDASAVLDRAATLRAALSGED